MAREDCSVRDKAAQYFLPSDSDVVKDIATQFDLTAAVVMHRGEEQNTC